MWGSFGCAAYDSRVWGRRRCFISARTVYAYSEPDTDASQGGHLYGSGLIAKYYNSDGVYYCDDPLEILRTSLSMTNGEFIFQAAMYAGRGNDGKL